MLESTNFASFNSIYTYPDKDFPHNNLVLPFIFTDTRLNCSCTLKWIHLYNRLYENIPNAFINNFINETVYSSFFILTSTFMNCKNFYPTLKCDFLKFLNRCHISENTKHIPVFRLNTDIDVFFLLQWLKFILLIILQHILSVFSIINNLLVILVIRNDRKNLSLKM